MPILDVEIVVADEGLAPGLAAALAEAAGRVFGTPAGHTWVRVRPLPRQHYAEDDGGPPAGVLPVFVTVVKARWPAPDELRGEVGRLTQEVARVCGRPPANVHVIYEPAGAGRVAFGGELVA